MNFVTVKKFCDNFCCLALPLSLCVGKVIKCLVNALFEPNNKAH